MIPPDGQAKVLKPYPIMKDSNVPWLGEIPKHWEVRRLKYLLRERDSRSSSGKEQLLRVSQYTGVTQRTRSDGLDEPDTRAESLVGYKSVVPEELVVNIMLAWNGSIGVSKFHGIVSPAYCVYRFGDNARPWFFHHLLRSPSYKVRIKAVSTGVVESRLRLYTDDLYRLEALVPPLPEQAAIVRFLDLMDQRIRKYIRAKQKLIKLLEEQKQAIIHRAVTQGLNPNVRLKPSGVEWLGDVPEHWQIAELVRLTKKIGDGLHGTPEYVDESEYHFINGNNLSNGAIEITLSTRCVSKAEFQKYKIALDDSTILMSINGTIGNVAFYRGESLVLGKSAAYINCDKSLTRSFLFFFLQSSAAKKFFQLELTGTTIFNLSLASIRDLLIAFPPLIEQIAISSFLELKIAEFTDLINCAQREIVLLHEYRTRLFADVVTGKLDVREAAAQLPDEAEEMKLAGEDDAMSAVDEEPVDDLDTAQEELGA